jgi:hypothetical protein
MVPSIGRIIKQNSTMSTITISPQMKTYCQTIINLITLQNIQISSSLKKYSDLNTILKNEFIGKVIDKLLFSRIDENEVKKCSFCNKRSYYEDSDHKLYCWHHRSQFEHE